jgi:hypothetical protein
MLKPLLAMACVLTGAGFTATVFAATDWTFEKISLTPRPGWCPSVNEAAPALEVRPCGEDYPVLSLAIRQKGAARQDLARLAATDAGKAGDLDGKKLVLDAVQTGREDCEENSFAVERAPMRGVPSFSVVATYVCAGNQDAPIPFTRFTAYAQGRDGSLWVVGFDHPAGPISDNDRAMIKSAIAKISGR